MRALQMYCVARPGAAMMPRTLIRRVIACAVPRAPMEEENRMQKYMRWSAMLFALLLVLAACDTGGGGDGSPDATDGGDGGDDPTAVCDADEFGCVEVAEG